MKHLVTLTLILIAFVFFTPADAFTINGSVISGANCRVVIWENSSKINETTSSSGGAYIFSELNPDTYEIVAYQSGFYPGLLSLELTTMDLTGKNITLTPISSTMTPTVRTFTGTLEVDHDGDGILEPAEPGDIICAANSQGSIFGLERNRGAE
ncbi:MAG: carboxypeptidase-like regulatory domain-containing protein [Candidatus Wallbacteria bacterium]|nr:carboxypeptidase-like regulatory domain-containing protein [Candidatus Wallbacteria bacterium]